MKRFFWIAGILFLGVAGVSAAAEFAGPIDAAHTGKKNVIRVVPTHENDKQTQENIHAYAKKIMEWHKKKSGCDGLLLTDEEALKQNLTGSVVLVYGTPAGNSWLAKYISQIPVRIEPDKIVADKEYPGSNLRFITAWPNPQDPGSGVVIYTAQRAEDVIRINEVYHGDTDYVIAKGKTVLQAACYDKKGGKWVFGKDGGSFQEKKNSPLLIKMCEKLAPLQLTKEVLEKKYSPLQLKEDLTFLFDTLEAAHPNLYARVSQTSVLQERKKTQEQLTAPMNVLEFYRVVAPLVATLNDGHTSVWPPTDALDSDIMFFPLRVHFCDGRCFLFNSKDYGIASGSELLSINGVPISEIFTTLSKYESGERLARKYYAVEVRFPRMLWIAYGFDNDYVLEYIPWGLTEKRVQKIRGGPYQDIGGKKTAKTEYPFAYRSVPEWKAGVIDFRSFSDLKTFQAFLSETFKKMQEEKVENLIIDIRDNGGGNSALGDALLGYIADKPFRQCSKIETKISKPLKAFAKELGVAGWKFSLMRTTKTGEMINPRDDALRFKGNTFVLINVGTFSSAVLFAGAVKDYKLGTLIGEETGGLATKYGDMLPFELPNTKLKCSVSYKRFVRPSGEDDGRGVIPDYEVKPSLEDILQGRDAVMEFTKELIKSNKPQDMSVLR